MIKINFAKDKTLNLQIAVFLVLALIVCNIALFWSVASIQSNVISIDGGARAYFFAPPSKQPAEIKRSFGGQGLNVLSVKKFSEYSDGGKEQFGAILDGGHISEKNYSARISNAVYAINDFTPAMAEIEMVPKDIASDFIGKTALAAGAMLAVGFAISLAIAWFVGVYKNRKKSRRQGSIALLKGVTRIGKKRRR